MKFVALLSGGKDSVHSTLLSVRHGHELVCCAHLAPSPSADLEAESYMYQTAGSDAVRVQVEECMGLPFHVAEIRGGSVDTSLVYDGSEKSARGDVGEHDEVEDLHGLLSDVLRHHPEVRAVSSGAILSTYQRTRIEDVCARLGLASLSYMWRMADQRRVLDSILDDGKIDAVLVRVACPPGLTPRRHLGRSLRELRDTGELDGLRRKWGMHPAGEGGEYETLVLDCPELFKNGRLVLEETEVVHDASDDGVGVLRIVKCRCERRGGGSSSESRSADGPTVLRDEVADAVRSAKSRDSGQTTAPPMATAANSSDIRRSAVLSTNLPAVRKMKGGLSHVSSLLSPVASPLRDESEAAVEEFLQIRDMLSAVLASLHPGDCPPTSSLDVAYVHLYLSEMSHFGPINCHYREFFGTHLPPSRACVGVGRGALPGGRRVMMDCLVQRGSGSYMRRVGRDEGGENNNGENDDNGATSFVAARLLDKTHALRRCLHVQSISSWAPVCIGPYSQANVLCSSLVFVAGMIGLVPETMALIEPGEDEEGGDDVAAWEAQLALSWRNAACVLDGLEDGGGRLDDALGGLVYVSLGALESCLATPCGGRRRNADEAAASLFRTAAQICREAVSTNAGVAPGAVDGLDDASAKEERGLDPSLYDEDGVLYGGYEDEGTWREMSDGGGDSPSGDGADATTSPTPLLIVCLAELPANAQAEVELVCASRRAASCLGVGSGEVLVVEGSRETPPPSSGDEAGRRMLWDTGHGGPSGGPQTGRNRGPTRARVDIVARSRLVGPGCACVSTVEARVVASQDNEGGSGGQTTPGPTFDVDAVLEAMIDASVRCARGRAEPASLFSIEDVLNVRAYYVSASLETAGEEGEGYGVRARTEDDGASLRSRLWSVLASRSRSREDAPACTVVPVAALHFDPGEESPVPGGGVSGGERGGVPVLAMQVTLVDMVRMETEMWARFGRSYEYDN